MQPGQVARRDYEYKRCGTANVFCGIEPKAGVHFTKVTPTRSSPEFADFILELAAHYPAADTIHLIVDNLSTHTRKALTDRFGENDGGWLWNRFTVQLHAHSWKLAQSGRDRDRSFRPPMPGKTQESEILANCVVKPEPGIAAQTASGSPFSGSSQENRPA